MRTSLSHMLIDNISTSNYTSVTLVVRQLDDSLDTPYTRAPRIALANSGCTPRSRYLVI